MVEWILNPTKPVTKGMAIAILVLNIIPFPGLGTLIYGRALRGIIEFVTSFILVGLIFAILDGIQVLTKATQGQPAMKPTA